MKRLNKTIAESLAEELAIDGMLPVEFVFHKVLSRKEHLFYPLPKALSEAQLKQLQKTLHALV
jgi:hypothetical protein